MNRECKVCGHPLRRQRQRPADAPGTRTGRNGVCTTCMQRAQRRTRKQQAAAEAERVRAVEAERDTWPLGPHMMPGHALDMGWLTDPALKALIHERRQRGIPAQGNDPTEIKR